MGQGNDDNAMKAWRARQQRLWAERESAAAAEQMMVHRDTSKVHDDRDGERCGD